jgi:L-threonylcarbamoyladenylate synthase
MNQKNFAHPNCNIARASEAGTLELAVQILGNGGLVAIPTETVYGLGAAIGNESALTKIFSVKGRPKTHPLIVHIADVSDLGMVAREISADALKLANACWPGPLTLLLLRAENVSTSVTGGRETVAVRVPANTFTRQLIKQLGQPLAAPSANRFGKVSPTTAQHVCDDLQQDVDLIVDDGAAAIGVESTIVDFSVSPPQLLRPGGISLEDIEFVLGYEIAVQDGVSRASGMLASHYQPHCMVLLAESETDAHSQRDELVRQGSRTRIIGNASDIPQYAATLYSQLRQADQDGIQTVIAIIPPSLGLGRAITDRLRKAATPSEA